MPLSSHSCKPIPPAVLEQAVAWLMRWQSGRLTATAQTAFDHWLREQPIHMEAWKRAEEVMHVFKQIPGDIRSDNLNAAISTSRVSRRIASFLAIFLSCLPLLGTLWRMDAFDV